MIGELTMPTYYKDRLTAIRNMFTEQREEIAPGAYGLLFDLWLEITGTPGFNQDLLAIPLDYDALIDEFRNRIDELVTRSGITDIYLRTRLKKLVSDIEEIRQESVQTQGTKKPEVEEQKKPTESKTKQDNSIPNSEMDQYTLAKKLEEMERQRNLRNNRNLFAIKTLLVPLGINVIVSFSMYQLNSFFFGITWKSVYALMFFLSILFINILMIDNVGRKNSTISDWEYFKKFQQIKTGMVSLLALLLGGLLTNALYDYIKDLIINGS